MNPARPGRRDLRILVYRLALALAFLVLVGRLGALQMTRAEYYQEAADVNRFRLEHTLAARGVMYDRRGHLLVRNMPRLTVSIVPAYLPEDEVERRAMLSRLSELIDMPLTAPPASAEIPGRLAHTVQHASTRAPGILDILKDALLAPYRPVLIKSGIARDVAMMLEEQHLDWPGVLVQAEAVRDYLYGPLTAHILGYMGPVPSERAAAYQEAGYDASRHLVGLQGLEYSHEAELRGEDGQKLVEVDVSGRQVRTVGEPSATVPGYNLNLTIDLDLQRTVTDILQAQLTSLGKKEGVVILINPQTGEVLALVSLPSYDNNAFTGGISSEVLQALLADPSHPLVNHGISGMFPPGSTFKLVPATGALEEGVVTTASRLSCGGILWLPNFYYPGDPSLAQPFYCWIHHGYHGSHGALGIVAAIGQSCDIYFYQLAGGYRDRFQGLGHERLAYYAELLGYGRQSGIDLPGETTGLVPDPQWKRANYNESWVTGDTYNMAIGQGYVLATPLQVVNMTAAVANGGTLYRPQIVHQVVDAGGRIAQAFAPDVIRSVPVSAENIDIVRQGMRAAVSGAGATARGINVPGVAVAGKTGSAEYFADDDRDGLPDRNKDGTLPTHAWFTAFAPYDNPEVAIVVFVYGGGEGSGTAVPVANEVLRYYFSREAGGTMP
ncbi:MAG TPA: penicillin-binding protein 2 [Anaerolineae bacterium]|nr:penicillin-binding protein 2 [Anaerolineae bacterium]